MSNIVENPASVSVADQVDGPIQEVIVHQEGAWVSSGGWPHDCQQNSLL